MKKVVSVLLTLALLFTLSACGGPKPTDSSTAPAASEPAKAPRVYKLADNHPDGYPTVLGDLKFAEIVKEKTNGEIVIEVYNNAVLGDEKVAIEQTQMGDIHFIRVGTNPLASINPIMNALSMPYLYRDRDHCFKVLDGEIGEEFLTSMVDDGLLGLSWFDSGARNFYNSKREVKTVADLKGLKIRVQETKLMMDLVSSLGGAPTPMAYNEIYSGIQNGVIEGAENNWPSYMSQSHNEVAPYFTVDQHTRAPEMILVNTDVWNSFSTDEQKIIKEAALEAAKFQRDEWVRQEKEYEKQAVEKGVTVTYLSPEIFQQFVDAVQPIYSDSEYTKYSDIINRIKNVK
ncbi:MAG: C4-dicarboxylate transporter [Anaerosolibacter sp.]|jgi:tripartite ATP-independent transporter DctP family solute receptor|uniref:TRAP transporter substrate-binding protein n=1 Tax=Anaerosolibacter sp. TaxID=1872527 RepID=UPI00262BA76C|nr:TRAP transporter substrate-binding protein [Anaerosolibacter sp.]MDF2547124.1 C4-dicarboxylate transporter [Anaerosolibacter sp.]